MAIFHAWLRLLHYHELYHPLYVLKRPHGLITQECFGKKTWIGHLYSVNKTFFVCHPVVVVGYNLSSTSTSAQFMVLSSHLYSRESQWNIFSWQCLPEKMMIMMMRFQKATWLSKGLQTISWTTGGKQRPGYYMYAKVNNAEKISKIDPFNFCSFQSTKSKPKMF